jgi:hypothetical protein
MQSGKIKVILSDGELEADKAILMSHCVMIRSDFEDSEDKTELNLKEIKMKIFQTKRNFEVLINYCAIAERVGAPDIQRPIHKFIATIQ